MTTSEPLRSRAFPYLLTAGLAAAQLLAFPGHYLGQEHDDAQYVLAARSILHGEYRLGISPGDPKLTFVTPGWPMLLAPAAWVSGERLAGFQVWALLWLVLCDALAWLWFSCRAPRAAAAAGTCVFALNPLILTRSGVAMSEIPCLAACLGLLLLLDRGLPSWAAGLWLSAAWLIRPAALPLFPAVIGFYLWKRQPRPAALCLVAGAIPILAWKAWVSSAGAQLTELQELALNSPHGPALLSMAALNLRQAVSLWGQSSLPWASTAAGPCLILGLILAVAAAIGLWRQRLLKDYEPAGVFLLCGALMHAFWPWWYERYLVAFLPFLIWAAWKAFEALGENRAAGLLLVWALSPLAAQSLPIMRSGEERSRPDLAETYAWIRDNTRPQDAFASAFYCRDAIYAGRPFIPLPPAHSDALRRLRAAYVLWEPVPDLGSSRGSDYVWSRALEDVKDKLRQPPFIEVYSNEREKTAVYWIADEGQNRKRANARYLTKTSYFSFTAKVKFIETLFSPTPVSSGRSHSTAASLRSSSSLTSEPRAGTQKRQKRTARRLTRPRRPAFPVSPSGLGRPPPARRSCPAGPPRRRSPRSWPCPGSGRWRTNTAAARPRQSRR